MLKKPEIREDYVHDRFVIVAPKRGKRPRDVVKHEEKPVSAENCPFCQEDKMKAQAILEIKDEDVTKTDWLVRVIKNAFPVLSYDNPGAYGTQEVVLETPRHDVDLGDLSEDHIVKLLEVYSARTKVLGGKDKIKYILIFKNHGGKAGASLAHAHSQIFASGFIPPHIVDKLTKAQEFRIKNGECYYCNLIKEEEKGPRYIWSDENIVVFTPYASIYNYEVWLMPRRHIDNIGLMTHKEFKSLAYSLKNVLEKIDEMQLPYNFYLHQAITDEDEHFYLRVCPRRDIWAGVEMGSRLIINSVVPEEAAKFYKFK